MVIMKVVWFEMTSIKIVSAKSQLSKIAENGQKRVSNNEMVLIKVLENGKTSLKIISAKISSVKLLRMGQKLSQMMKWY